MFSATERRSEHRANSSGLSEAESHFDLCDDYPLSFYLWIFTCALYFALGFPASVAVLWDFLKRHSQGTPLTPNDFFMLNLATMDVVFFSFIPMGVLNYLVIQSMELEMCWNFVYSFSVCGRPVLMACVCLDCYLAVVHPVVYHQTKGLTPRIAVAVVVWLLTVANSIVYLTVVNIYFTFYPIVFLMVVDVVIGFCTFSILYTLKISDRGRKTLQPQKRKAMQHLTNTLMVAIVSYLPPVIIYAAALSLITENKMFICTAGASLSIISTLGSVIMPLLHLQKLGKLDGLCVRCCRKS